MDLGRKFLALALLLLFTSAFCPGEAKSAGRCDPSQVAEELTPAGFAVLLDRAVRGDSSAQFRVGLAYEFGKGVQQDYSQAAHWYLKAAERDLASAQVNLGSLYSAGHGVPQDQAKADYWYRKAFERLRQAAAQEDVDAQFNLAIAYSTGHGIAEDNAEAIKWFRKAADHNRCRALVAMGDIYAAGRGVPRDDAEALRWYRRAAEGGDAAGQNNLAMMYAEGRGVAKDFSQMVYWFRAAAAQGDPCGQYNLGRSYALGMGLPEDHTEAARWLSKAAEQGHDVAQFVLGLMYDSGDGVRQDHQAALRWLRSAAAQHNHDAIVWLAKLEADDKGSSGPDFHVVDPGGPVARTPGQVTLADMDASLASMAHEYRLYAPVPRAATFDLALPANPEEYLALKKHAILLVSAVVQDAAELPLRRVYVRDVRGRDLGLFKIAEFRSETAPGSETRNILGPYKVHAFYLLPVSFFVTTGQLFVDFTRNREGFHVGDLEKMDLPCLPEGEKDLSPGPAADVPSATIETILLREFGVQLSPRSDGAPSHPVCTGTGHDTNEAIDLVALGDKPVEDYFSDPAMKKKVEELQATFNGTDPHGSPPAENFGPAGLFRYGIRFEDPEMQARFRDHVHIRFTTAKR